jgi:hypothetical protein
MSASVCMGTSVRSMTVPGAHGVRRAGVPMTTCMRMTTMPSTAAMPAVTAGMRMMTQAGDRHRSETGPAKN